MSRRRHRTPWEKAARPLRTRRRSAATLAAGCVAVFALTVGCGLAWPHLPRPAARIQLTGEAVRVARVIDGDTFVLASGEHVRILNIDTAEMPPRAQCGLEAQLALDARARLQALTRDGEVTLTGEGRDRDRYGRLLRRVRIDGRDAGEQLVREGLAQPWRGRRAQWC